MVARKRSLSLLKTLTQKQTLVPRKNKTSGASDDATVLVKRKRRLEGRRCSLHASVIEAFQRGEIANFKGRNREL
jgi:hypothetical protein